MTHMLWRIVTTKELPYDLGAVGTRVCALWLVAALSIALGASGLFARTLWAPSVVLLGASFSLLLCISDLPAARIGALVNVGVIVLLFVTQHNGSLA